MLMFRRGYGDGLGGNLEGSSTLIPRMGSSDWAVGGGRGTGWGYGVMRSLRGREGDGWTSGAS